MEALKESFNSLKEFIWDILGYLVPGSFSLILLSVCVNKEYFLTHSLSALNDDFENIIFLIISYIIGYVVYGVGLWKEKILAKFSYVQKIESEIKKSPSFSYSKVILAQSLDLKKIPNTLDTATVRDIRNLVMSFIPERDQKIYTFTFRSELANQIGNISIIIGVMGLIFSIFNSIPLNIFKTDNTHIILYICLIICYFLLRQTRNRFYAISVGMPFSIFTSKSIKNEL